jgi:hypothetical protein
MHGFVNKFAEGVFDPETVQILTGAFDEAWARVQTSNAPYAAGDYVLAGRTIVAKYIIDAATQGELDRRRLADGATLHLARQRLSKTPPNNDPGG